MEIPNEWCTGLEKRKNLQPTRYFWVHPCAIFELLTDLYIKSQCVMAKVFVVIVKTSIKVSDLNWLQKAFSCKSVKIRLGTAYVQRDGRQDGSTLSGFFKWKRVESLECTTCDSFERPPNGIVPDQARKMGSSCVMWSCGDNTASDGKENTVIGRTGASLRTMFLQSGGDCSFREMKRPLLTKEKTATKKKTITQSSY
jgi:hypothetical protein